MNAITISLSERRMQMLRKSAARFGMKPEDLVLASVEYLAGRGVSDTGKPKGRRCARKSGLSRSVAVDGAADYVIRKNDELLRRLA